VTAGGAKESLRCWKTAWTQDEFRALYSTRRLSGSGTRLARIAERDPARRHRLPRRRGTERAPTARTGHGPSI